MGSSQSKDGGLRRQVRPLVPRSWAELEQLHVRFQQEIHRRRRSEPELQHFLTFPVFHSLVAPLCPSSMTKVEFLAMFAALDSKRRGRISAIDLFSGLALVMDAKKAQKLDFLISLVENGGCKTLNRCELMIALSAAARGLAMLTMVPEPHRDAMKHLVRRLMGEEQEIARQSIVEKALVDAEILFFMNDLEGNAGTSEELLIHQAKLLSRMAFLDLQAARISEPLEDDRGKHGNLLTATAAAGRREASSKARAPASIDVTIRKLQTIVCPSQPRAQQPISFGSSRILNKGEIATANEAKKYVDARTIQRLITRISDGSLVISANESERLVSKMSVDQFGLVRCGEIFRTMSVWLHTNRQDIEVPFWKRAAQVAVSQVNSLLAKLNSSLAAISTRATNSQRPAVGNRASSAGNTDSFSQMLLNDVELNWNATLRVGEEPESIQPKTTEKSSRTSELANMAAKETIKFRLGVHPPEVASVDPDGFVDGDLGDEDIGAHLIVCFALRDDTTDEDAMNLAAATERLLGHTGVLEAFTSVWRAVRVTVGESTRNENGTYQSVYKQLRVCFVLSRDWLSELEDNSTIPFSHKVQQFLVLGEISTSLEDLVHSSLQAMRLISSLTKAESRESLLRSEFERFDTDKNGVWNLQEFNAFQQALGEEALDEDAVAQIFSAEATTVDEVTFHAFAGLYKHCSAAEMLALFQRLRVGSLDRLVSGTLSITCVGHRSLLSQITRLMANPSRWSNPWLKRLLFLGQSSSDIGYGLRFSAISDVFSLFATPTPAFLIDSSFISNCVEKWRELVHPPHQEHARDQTCESLRCSLEREIRKNASCPNEHNDQSTSELPTEPNQGETTVEIALRAVSLATALVLGPEMVELRGARMRLVCELDNLVIGPPQASDGASV